MPIVKATVGHPMRRAPLPLSMAPGNRLEREGKGVEARECQTVLGPLIHD